VEFHLNDLKTVPGVKTQHLTNRLTPGWSEASSLFSLVVSMILLLKIAIIQL